MSVLSAPYFHDEAAAYAELERTLWPHGPVCPRCGSLDRITTVKGGRIGLYRCGPCKRQFTVKVGTVFESSHVPLNLWLQAVYLMCSSKKGISAHQLMRTLDVQYKTAWFMAHRIREAMRDGKFPVMGGQNRTVEADETYVGGKARNRKGRIPPKAAVFALVERDGGVRSFHVANVTAETLRPILVSHVHGASYVMTDEAPVYPKLAASFAGHGTVNHSIEEYVRGTFWHTNTVEGAFSLFKRGITGIYHHVSQAHLHRYLAEFDFRYNSRQKLGIDDAGRTARALHGAVGKRLTYRSPN